MTSAAPASRADIDATVTLTAGDWRKELRSRPDNADVLQWSNCPPADAGDVEPSGKGSRGAGGRAATTYPAAEAPTHVSAFELDVQYGAERSRSKTCWT